MPINKCAMCDNLVAEHIPYSFKLPRDKFGHTDVQA